MSITNTFEVDVILTINTPAEGVRLCAVTAGINYNPAILNGGTPTNSSPSPGSTNTIVSFTNFGSTTFVRTASTTTSGPYVTLGYTQGSPFPVFRLLNSSLATFSAEASEQIATAFPNPFSSTFKLNLTTISNEMVQVSVYDMLGKLIEDFKVESNGINSFSFGEKYATGFYNVKVSQGDKTQVLRMIKQ
jgi:hypothetical protein